MGVFDLLQSFDVIDSVRLASVYPKALGLLLETCKMLFTL